MTLHSMGHLYKWSVEQAENDKKKEIMDYHHEVQQQCDRCRFVILLPRMFIFKYLLELNWNFNTTCLDLSMYNS